MTNLEKLLLNDADDLADKLTVPYYDDTGKYSYMLGYTGPHKILFSAFPEDSFWIRSATDLLNLDDIVEVRFDMTWNDMNGVRNACKEAVKGWLKAEYKEENKV